MDLPHWWAMGASKRVLGMQATLVKSLIVCGLVAVLAGCSNSGMSLLSGKGQVPQAANVPVGNQLAMPPDLSLAQPTATSDAYQPNGYVAPINQPATPKMAPPSQVASTAPSNNIYGGAAPAAPAGTGDVFEQAGISKTKPDGKPKTAVELNKELSAYYMAKKKQQNPSYGSVGNIGSIFN